jgi:periplasmic protein CpxP/Spy
MIQGIRSQAIVAGAALLLVAGMAAGVAAQGPGGGRRGFGPGGPGRGFPMLQELGLTDAQKTQVREVLERNREQMRETGKRLHDAHEAQRNAVETVPVNEALIRSTTQALANAQTDMALMRARAHSEVWGILTPDQQQKAKELKEQRAARRDERIKQRQERRQQRKQG